MNSKATVVLGYHNFDYKSNITFFREHVKNALENSFARGRKSIIIEEAGPNKPALFEKIKGKRSTELVQALSEFQAELDNLETAKKLRFDPQGIEKHNSFGENLSNQQLLEIVRLVSTPYAEALEILPKVKTPRLLTYPITQSEWGYGDDVERLNVARPNSVEIIEEPFTAVGGWLMLIARFLGILASRTWDAAKNFNDERTWVLRREAITENTDVMKIHILGMSFRDQAVAKCVKSMADCNPDWDFIIPRGREHENIGLRLANFRIPSILVVYGKEKSFFEEVQNKVTQGLKVIDNEYRRYAACELEHILLTKEYERRAMDKLKREITYDELIALRQKLKPIAEENIEKMWDNIKV